MSGKNKKTADSTGIIRSFDYAIKGLVYSIKTQRNMRIHLIIAIMAIIVSLFLNLTRIELIALIFAIALVLIAEILNTAIELIVDLITEEHHPVAKVIKDMSAGAVLFASICAAVVGYLIFMRKEALEVLEQSIVIKKIMIFPPHLAVVVLFLVLVVSLFVKGIKGRHPSIEGGMPSIHTALAFSLATIIFFLSGSFYVLLAALFLAGIVAQTRISSNIHNIWEVLIGAILGVLITVAIFRFII